MANASAASFSSVPFCAEGVLCDNQTCSLSIFEPAVGMILAGMFTSFLFLNSFKNESIHFELSKQNYVVINMKLLSNMKRWLSGVENMFNICLLIMAANTSFKYDIIPVSGPVSMQTK